MSAAHELSLHDWEVTVYETNREVGGFFRSARAERNMPSEYSWHGMGPWYHNVFDLMKQIPAKDQSGSIFDQSLSRPVSFGIVPDQGQALFDVRNRFRMTRWDVLRWAFMMGKTWTANRRSSEEYAEVNAAEEYQPLLSEDAWRTWRSCFGPWVGSDWHNVSLHQVGLFFRKQFFPGVPHRHAADSDGPAWLHGSRCGWLLLKGPSSEEWFTPWVESLEQRGVSFRYSAPLEKLSLSDDGRIDRAHLASGEPVQADAYVLATDPFSAEKIVARTPGLAAMDEFRLLKPLIQDGPHTQVSFRIAFEEPIAWPRKRSGVVIADSEYNLTIFAQEQAWRSDEDLGCGIASLWTGTACVSKTPGRLYGLPLEKCTKQQFLDEVMAQLASCEGLDDLIREANNGRSWKTFPVVQIEVWHEWMFSPEGISSHQPKWVNTTSTQPFLPSQRTPVSNLVLAGAHTRTYADVWSIEAAVESGRHAAKVFDPDVEIIPEYIPPVLRAARAVDDRLYALRLPHLFDMLLGALAVGLGLLLFQHVA